MTNEINARSNDMSYETIIKNPMMEAVLSSMIKSYYDRGMEPPKEYLDEYLKNTDDS